MSLHLIVPHVRPLEPYILDPTVTEIMVNRGGRSVFIERDGRIEPTTVTLDPQGLKNAIKRIAHLCDDFVSEEQPALNARMEDGSRVAAMLPPCAVDGATLTIRKFGRRYTLDELVAAGSLPSAVSRLLIDAITSRRNILISGGTGTGKTTMLNALAATIPDRDRIVLIEETSEIRIELDKHPNLVRFEARRKQTKLGTEDPMPAVTIAELLRDTLRHRPDRIILGEVRGAEAWDLLQALNTGHLGSMSTIHGNTAEQALTRLGHGVLMSGVHLPYSSIREAMALAIHLVVHIDRVNGQRRVTQLLAVRGYDTHTDHFDLETVYLAAALAGIGGFR